ncbi:tautomerase family protein [Acinetobacter calcoaceticus]|uniref:hypothetical protein n=1 Tax=Acinetobacter calcoaceticus TaxID=471 RepID=UPI0002CEA629|nr:hypothetical protein [Acinetobacter calcoaceticus]ENU08618.1 hypothetical protein F997_02065 [Acinetobacter calcoaceticus NIPH 13]WNY29610.1 tautomerase PptA [Acinetobacter calcoaceticus]
MPHIDIYSFPREIDKLKLTLDILNCINNNFQVGDNDVSISLIKILEKDWSRVIIDEKIIKNSKFLIKEPGYDFKKG